MHDIRAIRDNPAAFDAAMARRGLSGVSSEVLAIDEARRTKITAAEAAQAERNAASKEVGAAKAKGDEAEFERLRTLVAAKKEEIARKGGNAISHFIPDDFAPLLLQLPLWIPNLPFLPSSTLQSGLLLMDKTRRGKKKIPGIFLSFFPPKSFEVCLV